MNFLSRFMVLFILAVLWGTALFGSPFVTHIDPAVGPSSGGTTITITGSGFKRANEVNFGSTPATTFTIESDSSIKAISPAHVPQVVSITVTNPSGSSPSTPNSFFTFQGSWQLYVSNLGSNTVTIIDTSTNLVIKNLTVGPNPAGMALTPDGSKAYVANNGGDTISVIDAATLSELPTIQVGNQPTGIAITPDGKKAFVSNFQDNTVSIIDTFKNSVITTVNVGTGPLSIAITPDGKKAFVANSRSHDISVIDTATGIVIATISSGMSGPRGLIITPDGKKAYVSNLFNSSVTVIDTIEDTIITTITIDNSNLEGICITPDGKKVYVVDGQNPNVYVIDTMTDTLLTTIGVQSGNHLSIAATSDGKKVYVPNITNNSVSVIDTAVDLVIATILGVVNGNLFSLAFTPDSSTAYVGDFVNNIELAISVQNSVISQAIPTEGIGPFGVAITPDQAPLAKFSFKLAPAGKPSRFDATSSASPVGEIVNYFWDFGDGTTLSTPNLIVKHSYVLPGRFSVRLIVTNSAGTSTTQLSTPSSVPAAVGSLLISNDISITQNGGPTALSMQTISIISPFSVKDLRGRQVKNVFATQTERVNILTWKPPSGGLPPATYRIYQDAELTKLLAVIPADGRLEFSDHNRRKERTCHYFVVTVDKAGNFSVPAKVVICGK